MGVASDRAMLLREIYRIEDFAGDAELDTALADRGVLVVAASWRVIDPLPEAFVRRRGYLERSQGRPWQRWLKAELVAHFVLHDGDQTEMPLAMVAQQERQAHEFAGSLILGDLQQRYNGVFPVTYRFVADVAKVPTICVERWWAMVGAGTATAPAFNYA